MGFYLTLKEEFLFFIMLIAEKWMELETIMLSEVNQSYKDK
jgi:hypothetical protein